MGVISEPQSAMRMGVMGGPLLPCLALLLVLQPPSTHARKKIDVFVAGFFPVSVPPSLAVHVRAAVSGGNRG